MRGAALRRRKEGTGSLRSWMPLAGPGETGLGGAQAPQDRRRPGALGRRATGPVEMGPKAKGRRRPSQKSIPLVRWAWRGLQPLRPRPKHVRAGG